ncbi:MAG: phosphoglycerate mutase [Pseudomonadota bacterium]|nr:phosphoglycerate mutase [Pseudomonadota bacterium]
MRRPPHISFLLPRAKVFGAQRWDAALMKRLGQGDASHVAAGRMAQLARHFKLPGDAAIWPLAALSRQAQAGDAGDALWLRADPAWMVVDINGVRLLGVGEPLQLTQAEADALAATLTPLFAENGLFFDWPTPAAAWLRLPAESSAESLPQFADPADALGDDVFEHTDTRAQARQWRMLAGEIQMRLHGHAVNQARQARGLPPVNALWFWGGGVLPQQALTTRHTAIYAEDSRIMTLAKITDTAQPMPPQFTLPKDDALFDFSHLRDAKALQEAWLMPALAALKRGQIASLALDSEDGCRLHLTRGQALRFWRKPWVWPQAQPEAGIE